MENVISVKGGEIKRATQMDGSFSIIRTLRTLRSLRITPYPNWC